MKLQDYINYYMGCKVITADDNEQAELVGVSDDNAHLVHDGTGSYGTCDISGVKPLLRRLEDMTRDDMKPIWQLITGRSFPDSGRVVWFDKEERTSAKRFVMMSGVDRVGIEMTGYVWADCDLSHIKFNPHFVSHYLLQRGFDLFGLIPANLAIDIKQL